jgi:Icc-related predicted phosphoesterase
MKLGVVTDPHLAATGSPVAQFHNPYDFANAQRNLVRALEHHAAAGVDAIAMLGDLANGGDEASHELGLTLVEGAGIPVWAVPGNHDTDVEVSALATRLSQRLGSPVRIPTPEGESADGIRVAGLSLLEVDHVDGWLLDLPEVATWNGGPAVLVTHFSVISRERAAAEAGIKHAGDVRNRAAIEHALSGRFAPTIVLHGHHHFRDAATAGPVLQIGCASLIEPPHEAAVVEITVEGDETIVQVEHVSIAPYAVERLPVLSPSTSAWRFAGERWETIG